jgi:RNA polymerase sigma factor for flagellar operon FliA
VSAGFNGLVDAYARFDRDRTHSFEAYLDHRIRGAMLDELREKDPLTRDQRVFARKHSAAVQRLTQKFGRAPHETDVANELGMTLAAMREMQSRVNESTMRGAAATADHDLADAMDDEGGRPDAMFESRERRMRVNAAMARLPERHRNALRMYYDEDLTLRQIATVLGVTESRVSQIHSEAIAKLRSMVLDA